MAYSLKRKLRNKIYGILNKPLTDKQCFSDGYEDFIETGVTPERSYHALINLYCATGGAFNEKFNEKIIKNNSSLVDYSLHSSIFGSYDVDKYQKFNETLNADGYAFLDYKLPQYILDKLMFFALQTKAKLGNASENIVFEPENVKSKIYRFSIENLMNNDTVQSLIMDPLLLNIARNYLESEPIFDLPSMWWSTDFNEDVTKAYDDAAQDYHFDMDRVKWVKLFFYINDVTEDNGPHQYIRGTHKVGAKPLDILKRGYARIPDADLKPHYPNEDFITVCAEAGSVFFGDTKCWHKGTPLKKGNRLVLELEYTTSMFGTNYPKNIVHNSSEEFKQFSNKYPRYTSNIVFK